MKRYTAVETLNYIIELFVSYLENLAEERDPDKAQFVSGERIAYIECLEIIQCWEYARTNGLDFDIEKRFPV
ncbi:MAG: hypothetical protein K2N84_05310 [Clostridia bacterium]|nr:hypothetical protein [Clostridia bacterium]